ncbi:MAG: tol-pal system protein YbgF [Pseudomonadales bacterium]|jgi:tol-pal system protein YbgF|uniref:tol-pal system protein YbgF n=1 Tax=unclassified Ketobacter TaxID=2639109 RepID=UPI000C950972|nr:MULTISPECIES: tol-pal system protein YbgF [unclassified Ketobacter]MAQ26299.1 tol-pal system protein YbgF [Pseudomonadales bacterium]MEC8813166.1 tol-pal system protein YbgF [Pseudomonadota bacterium]HAG97162.1 tol-pal system protein YbgF [Gammaproteobacteria bacterium]RLT89884.1 MAG: tol-pal system protein YbgF [Ketobacter sp. GenoA1]RLT98896.1 MAG: tol-pal system protein YbgF [Ketobacter sp.]|tara:strand:+ start:544 stop:1368 length:825 start_codon:yes stop_codon:yes gene_type:complete
MLRSLLVLALSTVAAIAAAVPPYEPLPSNSKSTIQPASKNSRSASKPPVVADDYGDADPGFSYSAAVDSSPSAATSGVSWDVMSQMQQLQQEVLQLRGMVEELKHQIDIMQKQERERYLDLDMRINQMQSGAPSGATRGSGGSASSTAKQDDKALYEKASQLRKDGKYIEAIAVLQQLLQQSPSGLYAPYSEYWLGELYMVADPVDLDQAKRHFINLLANHGDHVKVPDAMYKLGKLYASKGENSKAKSTLNELIKQYPDKSASRLAQDLVKTL